MSASDVPPCVASGALSKLASSCAVCRIFADAAAGKGQFAGIAFHGLADADVLRAGAGEKRVDAECRERRRCCRRQRRS